MLSRWNDFERTFSLLDEFRKRMDRVWEDESWVNPRLVTSPLSQEKWPVIRLYDQGANWVVKADVPGMSEKDLNLSLHDGVLTVAGERKTETPTGYTPHRQERAAWKFSKAISLPSKVNAELASATIQDGVLTVTLAKAHDAQPRQIAVRAQN